LLAGFASFAALVALVMLATPEASAQQADPGFVVSRTVNPRIAYRGVPLEDNPVHVRATTFPARVFGDSVDRALGDLADDAALGSTSSSAGVVIDATHSLLSPTAGAGLFNAPATSSGSSINGAVPLGMGATVGGAMSGATQGLANAISVGVMGATQAATSANTGSGP